MSTVWLSEPPFPEVDLGPGTARFKVGDVWIDWNGEGKPTQDDVDAILNPAPQPKSDFELMRDYIAAKPDAPAELKASAAEAAQADIAADAKNG